LPYALTEHGAIVAAAVLNSERAIEVSIFVVRAFAPMGEALGVNQLMVAKLAELERRLESHDADIQELFEAIRALMAPPPRIVAHHTTPISPLLGSRFLNPNLIRFGIDIRLLFANN
jgi:hypothetical protein